MISLSNDPLTEHEIRALEPESMSVGKLNQVVRALRELLHEKQLKIQELEQVRQTSPEKTCIECMRPTRCTGWLCPQCMARRERGG